MQEWLPRRAVRSVERHFIMGTDHAFIEGNGRGEARDLAVAWTARQAGLAMHREEMLMSSAPE
jgi:hypothetical protein